MINFSTIQGTNTPKPLYDAEHRHLGYYENGQDLEAIALKVSNQNLWHVYFPFEEYGLSVPRKYQGAMHERDFGTKILEGENTEELQKLFTNWVETELLSKSS